MLGKKFIGQCKLKDLPYGYFRVVKKDGSLSNITYKKVLGDYSYSDRKYYCSRVDDICIERKFNGDTLVSNNFEF